MLHALGVPDASIPTAIAVAMSESGLDPCALGDNNNPAPGCHSWGLWQINVCPGREAAGPPFHGDDPSALTDPETNARAMMARSGGGQSWGAWTTYRTGAYIRNLPAGTDALNAVRDGRIGDWQTIKGQTHADPGAAVPGIGPNPISSTFALFSHIFGWLAIRHNQWRILEGAAGAVALVLGVVVLTRGITIPLAGAL